jgi:hypothetical protein
MIDSDPLTIEVLTTPSAAWLSLRGALWPHDARASHEQEVRQFLAEPARIMSIAQPVPLWATLKGST